ncbi:hypothetical protein RND81_05G028500 [Saponaria officinalis]|uniref:Uncharacterized protein n=1 Tax=Saponaria officinalis TaxID=3572 RepID=A0AAW1KX50_SAPOF
MIFWKVEGFKCIFKFSLACFLHFHVCFYLSNTSTCYRSTDLMKAVPDDHKKFLADLVWVHEEDNVAVETSEGLKHCKFIAVHGGLQQDKPVNEQLKVLKARDTSISKVECLSGRKTIWDMPEELKGTSTGTTRDKETDD